jgi:cation diffusion facilitator CzcD-associated flavoprotein CzcO
MVLVSYLDWSTTYSPQPEILAYQRKVARKYHLYDQAYFNTEVIQITWLDSFKKWKVEYRTGEDPKIKSEEFDIL